MDSNIIKTDKIDKYILIGCESDEIYENDKSSFNFRSNKFILKEIKMKNFKKIGWPFMTLFKKKQFFRNPEHCF